MYSWGSGLGCVGGGEEGKEVVGEEVGVKALRAEKKRRKKTHGLLLRAAGGKGQFLFTPHVGFPSDARRGRARGAPEMTADDERAGRIRRSRGSIRPPPRKKQRGASPSRGRGLDWYAAECAAKKGCEGRFKIMGGKGEVLAGEMEDSSDLWRARDVDGLIAALRRDGYLFLRGILPREAVEKGRVAALAALAREAPHLFAEDGGGRKKHTLVPGAANLGLLSRQHIAALPEVRAVVESDELFDLAEALLEGDLANKEVGGEEAGAARNDCVGAELPSPPVPSPVSSSGGRGGRGGGAITTAYKWFRAVGGGEFTGVHTDRVFLGDGSDRLITAWLPFSEVRLEDGPLMVARGSHRSTAFAKLRSTYGASRVGHDGTRSGWLTDDAAALPAMLCRPRDDGAGGKKRNQRRGGVGGGGGGDGGGASSPPPESGGEVTPEVDWRTSHFRPGDVAVITIDTVHMSAANCSAGTGEGSGAARVRVSCDTRWQPAGERTDPRVRLWRRRSARGVVVDQPRVGGREVAF